jgi:glycosyltransferase involved in cell wall biosynthesis
MPGAFSTDRGMVVIAGALQRLAAQGLRPRLRLLGTWTSPAEEQAFWQAAIGLEGQVEMVGWVPFEGVPAQLVRADAALARVAAHRALSPWHCPSSYSSTWPAGLPMIVSDFPPNRAVVSNADCGLLVDPTDADAIADAISRLIAAPTEAHRLGQNGRRAFETQYNWQSAGAEAVGVVCRVE